MNKEYHCPYCYSEIEGIGKECKMCGTYANKYEKKFDTYEYKFPCANKDSVLDGYIYSLQNEDEEMSFNEIPEKFYTFQLNNN